MSFAGILDLRPTTYKHVILMVLLRQLGMTLRLTAGDIPPSPLPLSLSLRADNLQRRGRIKSYARHNNNNNNFYCRIFLL